VHVLNTKRLTKRNGIWRGEECMSYCSKCGAKVREEMSFCPKCGTPLKVVQPPVEAVPTVPQRVEKAEKREEREKEEKHEKTEKEERYEKREFGYIGPLVGGFILLFVGLIFYLIVTASLRWEVAWAFFFIVIGIVIIVGAVYAATMAAKRHPET